MSPRQPSRWDHSDSNPSGHYSYPRYKVSLLRSPGRGLMAVVRAVMDLTHYGAAEAEFRMWEAHHGGRAVVLVTHLERAELYAEQFAARGLAVCIERE